MTNLTNSQIKSVFFFAFSAPLPVSMTASKTLDCACFKHLPFKYGVPKERDFFYFISQFLALITLEPNMLISGVWNR